MPKEIFFDTSQDIGIYTEIELTEKRDKKRYRLYKAKCKICGKTVYRIKYDLIHYHDRCLHNRENSEYIESSESDKEWIQSGYTFTVYGVHCKNSKNYPKTTDEYSAQVYNLWRHMIQRTTPSYWKKYPNYQGTTVSEEWKDYSIFYDDIKELDGYKNWLETIGETKFMIDKDTKVPGNKHYSKQTCCFLSYSDSSKDVMSRHPELLSQDMFKKSLIQNRKHNKHYKGRKIKAINLTTKEEYYFYSIKDCGKFLHTNPANIQMCLSKLPQYAGHYTCKGHTFEEVSQEDFDSNLDKVIVFEVKENPNI